MNWYDYGFGNYDAQIGRFTQLDPLTWEYQFLTPYQYASNDPITNIDIDGLEGGSAVKIFTGSTQAAAELAATAAANAGTDIGEVVVRSSIKKAIKKTSESLLSKIGSKSVSLMIQVGVYVTDAIIDARDKVKNQWNTIRLNNEIETFATGKGFVERSLDKIFRLENLSTGPMGLGGSASNVFFRPQLQYHLVGPELNLRLAVPLKGGSVTELYQVVGTGIVYSTSTEEINISEENKIPRDQLIPPSKPGNAPKFKKDNKPVEIHHENQNPNGPFREIHPDDHRRIPNPIRESKIDRQKFKKQRESYWKREFPNKK